MLKYRPVTAFMKIHANFKNIFLIRFLWFKCIFAIKFKIRILDLMLLQKTVFHLTGYTTVVFVAFSGHTHIHFSPVSL